MGEVEEKIKKDKAPPEETKEDREAKLKATPVKKPNPESEEGDLDPPKKEEGKEEEKEELTAQLHEDPAPAKKEGEEKKEGGAKGDGAVPAGPVEKVHDLNPTDWQDLANNNSPGFRTTFYDKKNSLWRQATELVQLNSQWM